VERVPGDHCGVARLQLRFEDHWRRSAIGVKEQQDLPAGDFSSWLRQARNALRTDGGTDVECGECVGCCTSSYFIHVRPEEGDVLSRIAKDIPVAAPGLPQGHMLLGYDQKGICPMLVEEKCSIYEHRPLTCRQYDCRVFAAAGIVAGGGDKARINERVRRWKFSYPTMSDRDEHLAVQAAARFIREHAESFPSGRTPSDPSQLAVLALKAYGVFLGEGEAPAAPVRVAADTEVANAVVEACREFDAMRR
jgi:Fe-S-cluster containining protein